MAVATLPRQTEPQYPAVRRGMMGMYIFLAPEVMFFGSLFASCFYVCGSHIQGPPPQPASTPEFYVNWWPIPAINTVVLLSSGVTCHFASDSLAQGNRRRFFMLWIATIILGLGFEGGQIYEFIAAYGRGLTLNGYNTFASAFFTMTGFHGAHVLGGLVLLAIILYRATRGQFSPQNHVGVAAVTLYWHFVDVVWIFLFGILYLGVTLFR